MTPNETCAVCGRTILAGERTRTYISRKHGPGRVCGLCRERAQKLGWVDPTAPGANVGRQVQPALTKSPAARLERAVGRFNASQTARTVAGLIRTLGEPSVSIGSSAGSPNEVRITVAWDLGWYQWGVDVADELRPVFQINKGDEVDELDGSARQWNATAAPDGKIALGMKATPTRHSAPVG